MANDGKWEERTPERWLAYYQKLAGRPPRKTAVQAIEAFAPQVGEVVDLGCGAGNDALAYLQAGWRVHAIDGQAAALEFLEAAVPAEMQDRLTTQQATFEALQLSASSADVVNASFALPFCPPEHFDIFWQTVVGAIREGGRFAGQFFGDRDTWAERPDMTCHSRAEVRVLLADFEIEFFEEEDEPESATALGRPKHWHIFWVVARKKGRDRGESER